MAQSLIALAAAAVAMDPLLSSRGKLVDFKPGDRVKVSARCGEWGADNLGTVQCVASGLDPKGRHFIGVRMDGMRDHVGKPECALLRYVELVPGKPPLPHFEAGLVTAYEA